MTLPVSGAISMSEVNTELGDASTTLISLGQASVRTLFGVASGAISLNDGHGKSNTYNLLIYVNGGGGGTVIGADYPSSGAGGGGYAYSGSYYATPGGSGLTVTIGAGGAAEGNHCASRAPTGGTSSITGGPSMYAYGGQGGGGGAGCSGGAGKSGGTGGTASGGTTNTTGEQGQNANTSRPGPGSYGGASFGSYGGARTAQPGTEQVGIAGNAYGGGAAGPGVPSDGFRAGAAGAAGVVVIKYLGSQKGTGGTVTSAGGYTIHTFTSSGVYYP